MAKESRRQVTTQKTIRMEDAAIAAAERLQADFGHRLGPLASGAIIWIDSLGSTEAWTLILGRGLAPGTEKHLALAIIEALKAKYTLGSGK